MINSESRTLDDISPTCKFKLSIEIASQNVVFQIRKCLIYEPNMVKLRYNVGFREREWEGGREEPGNRKN